MFPRASGVQKYLEDYAEHFDLTSLIRFRTSVVAVDRTSSSSAYEITLSTGETLFFDFVIVCNGHYRRPRYPRTLGLERWLNSKKAVHSAWYRSPEGMDEYKTVLVVGAGPSGQDISAEMARVMPTRTVIHSVTGALKEDIGNIKRRGRVISFGSTDSGEVEFEDGTKERSIDYCILATGYEMSFPFLSNSILGSAFPPSHIPPLPKELYNSSYHVFPLARHVFPLSSSTTPPSLAFMGLAIRVAPFPLLEAQASAIARVFGNAGALDMSQEANAILKRYEDIQEENGQEGTEVEMAKKWHVFKAHEQFDYRDEMHRFGANAKATFPIHDDTKLVIVEEWEKEMYNKKDVLRKVWVDLVHKGQADDFVKGIGEGGREEWIDLMKKMLEMAEIGEVPSTSNTTLLTSL